jgi:hypothetical protein
VQLPENIPQILTFLVQTTFVVDRIAVYIRHNNLERNKEHIWKQIPTHHSICSVSIDMLKIWILGNNDDDDDDMRKRKGTE